MLPHFGQGPDLLPATITLAPMPSAIPEGKSCAAPVADRRCLGNCQGRDDIRYRAVERRVIWPPLARVLLPVYGGLRARAAAVGRGDRADRGGARLAYRVGASRCLTIARVRPMRIGCADGTLKNLPALKCGFRNAFSTRSFAVRSATPTIGGCSPYSARSSISPKRRQSPRVASPSSSSPAGLAAISSPSTPSMQGFGGRRTRGHLNGTLGQAVPQPAEVVAAYGGARGSRRSRAAHGRRMAPAPRARGDSCDA